MIRAVDRNFGQGTYSLKLLFRDEQRKVLDSILEENMEDVDSVYRQLYMQNAPLMRFLSDIEYPVTKSFRVAAELALNAELRRVFTEDLLDVERIKGVLQEAVAAQIAFDGPGLGYALRKTIERMMGRFLEDPDDLDMLRRLNAAVEMGNDLPFEVTFWKSQNLFFEVLQSIAPRYRERAGRNDADAPEWLALFSSLGEKLFVHVPEG